MPELLSAQNRNMVNQMSEVIPSDDGGDRIRASDADRDAVAHQLREALAEGRLDPHEHTERLDSVYRAKTLGELAPLTRDLPGSRSGGGENRPAPADFRSPRPIYGRDRIVDQAPTTRSAIAVMGGADRSGRLVMPGTYVVFACMGGIEIDLREFSFTQAETTIWVWATMGGLGITAPDDIQVRVHGIPIMGGFGVDGDPPSVVEPDAPIVHVRGLAIMGGVGVTYRKRKHQAGYREEDEDDDE